MNRSSVVSSCDCISEISRRQFLKTGAVLAGAVALSTVPGARSLASGELPKDLKPVADAAPVKKKRDVFVYFISGAKERAPGAAMALIKQLGD